MRRALGVAMLVAAAGGGCGDGGTPTSLDAESSGTNDNGAPVHKDERPGTEIENTSWGKIKETFT